ncbi:MAG: hypothetical protein ACWGSQ_20475 [Longimicrobiales bacterium]
MSIRWIRGGAVVFFLLFVAAVTWPGMMLGNRIFPLVLGLPFSMVWIASWVVLSFMVLVVLDHWEGRARDRALVQSPDSEPHDSPVGGRPPDGEA